jgi:predicted regulator of Ras-like GTPase activity (Roadblock/LC7/MglB family)
MRYARTLPRLMRKGRNKLVGIEAAVLAEIQGLRVRLPHVTGVLVASTDGLLVASDLPGTEPEGLAAMCAAQLGLAQQVAAQAHCGGFQENITRAADGYVATFAAGTSALLTVVAGAQLNVARLYHEARPLAARVGELAGAGTRPAFGSLFRQSAPQQIPAKHTD